MDDLVSELPARSSAGIHYRAALARDSRAIGRLFCLAGDGLYEFLFDDLIPFVTAEDILAAGIGADISPISYRHCHVAVDADDEKVVGAANAFPADLLKQESHVLLPDDRQKHVRPMLLMQDWGSMFLNVLAVCDACRGRGVGTRLLAWAEQQTRRAGLDRLSLHVWAHGNSPIIAGSAAAGTQRHSGSRRLDSCQYSVALFRLECMCGRQGSASRHSPAPAGGMTVGLLHGVETFTDASKRRRAHSRARRRFRVDGEGAGLVRLRPLADEGVHLDTSRSRLGRAARFATLTFGLSTAARRPSCAAKTGTATP